MEAQHFTGYRYELWSMKADLHSIRTNHFGIPVVKSICRWNHFIHLFFLVPVDTISPFPLQKPLPLLVH